MARSRRPGRTWRDAGIGSFRRHRQARLHMLCALACVIGAAPLMALVLGRTDRPKTNSLEHFCPSKSCSLQQRRPQIAAGVGPTSPAQHLIGGDASPPHARRPVSMSKDAPSTLHSTLPALNSSTKAARFRSKGGRENASLALSAGWCDAIIILLDRLSE